MLPLGPHCTALAYSSHVPLPNKNDSLCVFAGSEDLVARTTIVGIIMAFRKLTLEALNSVLSARIPFLLSSITDFKLNLPDKSSDVRVLLSLCVA